MSRTRHHVRGRGKHRHTWYGSAKHPYRRGRALRERVSARFAFSNPDDVAFELCELENPRRDGSMTRGERRRVMRRVRRSWQDPYGAHDAIDELGLEKLMRSRRGRRTNPRSRSGRTWFRKLPKTKQKRIISLALGRMNPGRSVPRTPSARDWRGFAAVKRAMRINPGSFRAKDALSLALVAMRKRFPGVESRKHPQHARYMRLIMRARQSARLRTVRRNPRPKARWKKRKPMSPGASYAHDRHQYRGFHRTSMNPKRDGSPTRGEKRKVKYLEYLKAIAERGQEARSKIAGMTGAVPKAEAGIFEPMGKRAVAHAVKEHTKSWETQHREELQRKHDADDGLAPEAPAAAPAVVESPELRHITSRLHDLDVLHKDYQAQLTELEVDEDQNAGEIEMIHGEIAKLAKTKKVLREKLSELQPTATNPRRRGRGRVRRIRISPRAAHRLRRASYAAGVACARLRHALARARAFLRSHRR